MHNIFLLPSFLMQNALFYFEIATVDVIISSVMQCRDWTLMNLVLVWTGVMTRGQCVRPGCGHYNHHQTPCTIPWM